MEINWKKLLVALIAVSIYVFFLVLLLLLTDILPIFRELIALAIAGCVLLIVEYAMKRKVDGLGIIIWSFILALIISLLFEFGGKEKKRETNPGASIQQRIKVTEYAAAGTYQLNLEKGQTSGWISIAPGLSYKFSNPDANFRVQYIDGTIVYSKDVVKWPAKGRFLLENLGDEELELEVSEPLV